MARTLEDASRESCRGRRRGRQALEGFGRRLPADLAVGLHRRDEGRKHAAEKRHAQTNHHLRARRVHASRATQPSISLSRERERERDTHTHTTSVLESHTFTTRPAVFKRRANPPGGRAGASSIRAAPNCRPCESTAAKSASPARETHAAREREREREKEFIFRASARVRRKSGTRGCSAPHASPRAPSHGSPHTPKKSRGHTSFQPGAQYDKAHLSRRLSRILSFACGIPRSLVSEPRHLGLASPPRGGNLVYAIDRTMSTLWGRAWMSIAMNGAALIRYGWMESGALR